MPNREQIYRIKFDIAAASKALTGFNKKLEKTEKLIAKIQKSGATMFKAMKANGRGMERAFQKVDKALEKTARKTKSVGKAALNTSKQVRHMGTAAKGSSTSMAGLAAKLGLFVAAAAGIRSAVRDFVSFDDTMTIAAAKFSRLDKTMAPGQKGFKEMREHVRALSKETELSAAETAKAVDFWAKAGKTFEQTKAVLPVTLDFASAIKVAGEEADVGRAGDILSDALGQFNLGSDDPATLMKNTARIADVMSKAANTANLSASELFESFKTGGPVLSAAGQSIEQVAAFMAVQADAGIKGSKAGRMMKTATVSLTAPTKLQAALLKKLNIETKDSEGNFKGITKILGDVDRATKDMGTGDRTEVFAKLVGREGIVALINLLNKGEDALGDMSKELVNAKGSAKGLADVVRQSAAAQLDKLGNKFKDLAFGVLENGDLIGKLTTLLEVLFEVFKKTGEHLDTIFGPILSALSDMLGIAGDDTEALTEVISLLVTAFIILQGAKGIGGMLSLGASMTSFFTAQGANAAGMATKMGTATKALGLFTLAATAAFAAKQLIDDAAEDLDTPEKTRGKVHDLERKAKNGTAEEKKAALIQLTKIRKGANKERFKKEGVVESLNRGLGGQTQTAARESAFRSAQSAENRVRESIEQGERQAKLKRDLEDVAMRERETPKQRKARLAGANNSQTNNFNIKSADPKGVAREVEKVLRKEGKKIGRAAAGIGAGEQ